MLVAVLSLSTIISRDASFKLSANPSPNSGKIPAPPVRDIGPRTSFSFQASLPAFTSACTAARIGSLIVLAVRHGESSLMP